VAEAVENRLSEYFQLAEGWGCIVLLDEADVFLARRERKDLERNALVSVFLRTLEYYGGILFLTTNRTGDVDEAFRSRFHVALHYGHLERQQSAEIWRTNLRRLLRQRVSLDPVAMY
jgi:AAA+ superfamily predicted ATPase